MGLNVIALDIGADRLEYCKKMGADYAIDVSEKDVVEQVHKITDLGVHGVACFATSNSAFKMAIDISRPKGVVVAVGLPKGDFPCPILPVVLKGITIKGSIVGTRQDMLEAIDFSAKGIVKCSVEVSTLDNITEVFSRLKAGKVVGRVVLKMD